MKLSLPDWQRAIYERCAHPSGHPIAWEPDDVLGSVVDRFEKVVRTVPGRPALRVRDGHVTYEALNETANRIARAIATHEGDAGRPVALLLGHGAGLPAALLGVLKAGRFATPLDPGFPQHHLERVVSHSTTRLLVTNAQHYEHAVSLAGDRRFVLNINELDQVRVDLPSTRPNGASPCLLLYTSGSTGDPKGFLRSHEGILRSGALHAHQVCPEDTVSLLRAIPTGSGTNILWDALLNGAAVCALDVKNAGASAIGPWVQRNAITMLSMGAPLFRSFIGTLDEGTRFPTVRLVELNSQTVLRSDFDAYRRHFDPPCVFATGLSGTEQGGAAHSRYYLDHSCEVTTDTVPVGYAVDPDKERYLIDEDGRPAPRGDVGEIVVKSRFLSPGHWNDAARTAATFVPDPDGSGRRIFRTGDVGRERPDGCLEIIGRTDLMVKIRGNRVELSAIESALLQHPAIKDAVVVPKDDAMGGKRLAAFVVPKSGEGIPRRALRTYLAERLPSWAQPSWIVELEALPHLPGGKVDRRALPNPALCRPDLAPHERPWSDVEKDLVNVWIEVLGVDRIGVDDDFIDLGGDSLLAAALLVKVQGLFKRRIPLATLLEANTVSKMALLLSGTPLAPRTSSLVPIQPVGAAPPFFCVPGAGGHVYDLAMLARRLGTNQPFFGLEPPGRDGEQPPLRSIEDMADLYIREMRTVQPSGPYHIGAYSWGGSVALEMAHRLLAAGEEVALLAILDSAFSQHDDEMRPEAPRRKKGRRAQLKALARRAQTSLAEMLNPTVPDRDRRRSPVWDASRAAKRKYRHRAYAGKITYFRSAQGKPDAPGDTRSRWESLALGGLEVHVVPGNHYTMLEEPHVRGLADSLGKSLEAVRPASPVAPAALQRI